MTQFTEPSRLAPRHSTVEEAERPQGLHPAPDGRPGVPFPDAEVEVEVERRIVAHEAGVDEEQAARATIAGRLSDDPAVSAGSMDPIDSFLTAQPA